MEVPSKNKNRTTIQSGNPPPGYISGKEENSNSKRYMHPNVHSSTMAVHSQDMETTHVPINRLTTGLRRCSIYIHTMGYYSAIKKNEILPFAATWMDLENIILSEVSQTETNII